MYWHPLPRRAISRSRHKPIVNLGQIAIFWGPPRAAIGAPFRQKQAF